jgi:hypothetical protein
MISQKIKLTVLGYGIPQLSERMALASNVKHIQSTQ